MCLNHYPSAPAVALRTILDKLRHERDSIETQMTIFKSVALQRKHEALSKRIDEIVWKLVAMLVGK